MNFNFLVVGGPGFRLPFDFMILVRTKLDPLNIPSCPTIPLTGDALDFLNACFFLANDCD